jgi:hypothetical protein
VVPVSGIHEKADLIKLGFDDYERFEKDSTTFGWNYTGIDLISGHCRLGINSRF